MATQMRASRGGSGPSYEGYTEVDPKGLIKPMTTPKRDMKVRGSRGGSAPSYLAYGGTDQGAPVKLSGPTLERTGKQKPSGPVLERTGKQVGGQVYARPPGGKGEIPTKRDFAQEYAATMNAYNSMNAASDAAAARAKADYVPGYEGGPSREPDPNDTWRYGSPGDNRGAGGGGYSAGGGHVPFNPADAIAKPDRPQFNFEEDYNLPDYNLPDEDMGVYKAAYSDATAGQMKEIRNQSMQAIFSSRSSQNPNERAMLVEAALSGAGKAYESIGRAGTQAAKSEAGRRRAEQITEYNNQWGNEAKELDKKYQSKWQTAIYDFGAQQQEYATDYAAYAAQPKDLKGKNPLSMGGTTQGYMG